MTLFKIIRKFKFLRGTFLDPFGYLSERKSERKLIEDYKNCILDIGKKLSKDNYDIAVDIASAPDQIRGFGYVKEKNIKIIKFLYIYLYILIQMTRRHLLGVIHFFYHIAVVLRPC